MNLFLYFFIFVSISQVSSAASPLWQFEYKTEIPKAVFFEASSGFLFVSVNDSKKARLDKFDLKGNFIETVASLEGEAGPMRAYDGTIYWVVGNSVFGVTEGKTKKIFTYPNLPSDIAIDSKGKIFLGFPNGEILQGQEKITLGAPVQGLLYYVDSLYVLRSGKIESLDKKTKLDFCDCLGLEKTSSSWIATKNEKVYMLGSKKIKSLEAGSEIARFAFVYRMDEKENFLVLPLPKLKQVRAIQIP